MPSGKGNSILDLPLAPWQTAKTHSVSEEFIRTPEKYTIVFEELRSDFNFIHEFLAVHPVARNE